MLSRQNIHPSHQHPQQNGTTNLPSISPPSAVSPSSPAAAAPQPLTQHDLNFSVIKRQLPALEAIIAKVSHTTIYAYSPTLATWEKSNIEGCLFLLRLSPLSSSSSSSPRTSPPHPPGRPRYALFLLNRRYLSTWAITLTNPAGIDLSSPIIQLRGQATVTDAADGTFGTSASDTVAQSGGGGQEDRIWGVWVYEDTAGSTQNERAELDGAILACLAGDGAR